MDLGTVTRLVGRASLIVQKHAPTILSVAGAAGVVGTAVLASKATLSYNDSLEQEFDDLASIQEHAHLETYTEELQRRDRFVMYSRIGLRSVRHYALPIAAGALTIGAIIWSNRISTARLNALMGAYAAVSAAFENYRSRIAEAIGGEKVEEIISAPYKKELVMDEVAEDDEILESPDAKKLFDLCADVEIGYTSPYARVFDQSNHDWSPNRANTEMFLHAQQNYLNDLLHSRGHVFLNEAYDALGLSRTQAGAVVGWVLGNGDNRVSIGYDTRELKIANLSNGRLESVYVLDFNVDGVIWDKI